jgi:eukaryotic-like serine/threonine-protein kinase
LRTRTRLTEAARDWKNGGHDPAYLYTGARLAVVKEWEASHPGELSTDEAEFLTRSLEAQSQREASELKAVQDLARAEAARAEEAEKHAKDQKDSADKLRLRAWIAAGLALVAVIFAGAVALVWQKSESNRAAAEEQARIAETRRLAAQTSEKKANAARDQADGLINFMLYDLRDKLEPIGRLDVLDDVAKKAKGYLV